MLLVNSCLRQTRHLSIDTGAANLDLLRRKYLTNNLWNTIIEVYELAVGQGCIKNEANLPPLLRNFSVAISVSPYVCFISDFYVSKIMYLWARNLPRKPNN